MTCKHVKCRKMRGMTWGSIWFVILGRILLVQLIEANNSLVVLEPKLVA